MNTKHFRTAFVRAMYIMVILTVVLSVSMVSYAAPSSPFVGHWEAIDVDGSDIRLTIGGPPNGPFQITWTESYISFCDGDAGIVRGTGWLNESDANVLEADLHVECFTTGESLDFHMSFRYHPATNTLSSRYDFGNVIIWHRPGGGQVDEPPALGLRVNYGHDWVESFYEAGHMAWITVTESDGVTVKATAELVTEPKDFWDGETGFQTQPEDWNPSPPDIQPYDWVYVWVDNAASAQVQIGDIDGQVSYQTDGIVGRIEAPWITDAVSVECLDWGSGHEPPYSNKDGGLVLTNGSDPYSCSWTGEWDIEPYQDVGVGYSGPDGHWVANAFTTPFPRIVASEAGDWFWVTEFYPGPLNLFIYKSADVGAAELWSGQQEATDLWGITNVGFDIHGQDLLPDNYLVVSDGVNEKGLVLETITMEVFDTENEVMAGIAPAGREVMVVAGMAEAETQATIHVTADPLSGVWLADFSAIPFDITEDMRPWSFAQIFDEDGDANEAGAPPKMDLRVNYGHDWVESFYEGGHTAWITVTDADGNVRATTELVTEPKWYWGGETGFQSIDSVWFDGDGNQLENPPDIQPYDWVYTQVDNGATAQVQLGDIQGDVRSDLDSITGTINVPWLSDPVPVECLDWGSGAEPINKDAGFVQPDSASLYSCNWDPEAEWDVQPWQDIGVGYFTPNGHWVANAFRDERWMAFWTYTPDPPTGLFPEGEHSYSYEWTYTAPVLDSGTSGPRNMTIAGDSTPIYDGYALIGPWGLDYPGNFGPQMAWTGSACEEVSVLHPDQPMRIVWGWVNDYSMTYEEALAHFTSFTIDFFWDGETGGSVTLATMSELVPFTGMDARFEYLCTLTEHP